MARQKAKRFADSITKPNIIQAGKPEFGKLKGVWADTFYKNGLPLIAEVGCGKGDYTIGLARQDAQHNYIGIDIKGPRIWVGAEAAQQEGLANVAFLRTEAQNLDMHFAAGELSEIWIPFPDPQPKGRNERRRLTGPRFIGLYAQLLKLGGIVRLKTDSQSLYDYTLEVLAAMGLPILSQTEDLYASDLLPDHAGIVTGFEQRYLALGYPIYYLTFAPHTGHALPRPKSISA